MVDDYMIILLLLFRCGAIVVIQVMAAMEAANMSWELRWQLNGIECMTAINRKGVYCGYAGVRKSNPHFQMQYEESSFKPECPHGQFSHSGFIPWSGEPEVWWFGFCCDGPTDAIPRDVEQGVATEWPWPIAFKELAYVEKCVDQLAEAVSVVEWNGCREYINYVNLTTLANAIPLLVEWPK